MTIRLHSRTARRNLKPRHSPYYERIDKGVYLSYRRAKGQPVGRWGVRLYAGDKKYKERSLFDADDQNPANGTSIQDYDQARDHARRVAKAINSDQRAALGTVTVSDAMADYMVWYRENRKAIAETKSTIRTHIKPALGRKRIASLTTKDIRAWHSDLAGAPARTRGVERPFDKDDPEAIRRRRATANRILTVLKAGLNYAFHEGDVVDDTAWRRVKPFPNVEAPRVRFLTISEAKRLVNSSDPDFRPLVRAALLTGARYGELGALRVQDYDEGGPSIYIRDSKSGKPRHVPLTDEGQDFFESHTAGRESDEALFVRADGAPWGKSHQTRPLRDAAAKAKLKDVSFHVLRHTYGSFLAAEGVPLQIIAVALGHADTRTTEKHYAHLLPDHVAATIRAKLPTFSKEKPKVRILK